MSNALRILAVIFFVLGCFGIFRIVEAHQSGCHRWHSCPSDTGSYVCGDLGYACQYPTYSSGSYSSSYSSYSPSSYSTPTCPANSYSSGSSCKCNYGYVVSGGRCVSGYSYCTAELGIMSTYDSLSSSCKCMAGYVIGSSGFCTYKSTYSTSYPGYSYTPDLSCPTHSKTSSTDPDKCDCDTGYQVNGSKNKCVKIPKKTNDKICRAEFGSKSEWSREYDNTGTPTCGCTKKYEWSEEGTSCVKQD